MKLGVTATQNGLTARQHEAFVNLLHPIHVEEFHHGGCVGGDEQLHNLFRATKPKTRVVVHWGDIPQKRAVLTFREGDSEIAALPNLERNHNIVDRIDELWGFPSTNIERLRSGTWTTIRYARKQGRPNLIVYPSGLIVYDGIWERG